MTTDPVLSVMLLLKNNWSLTESGLDSGSIVFSTTWYDTGSMMPQIVVTPTPGGSAAVMECGSKPLYGFSDYILIDIWVRPSSESNKSFGSAKHKIYAMRKEVERILRSGSIINEATEEWISLVGWRRLDELNTRPIILRSQLRITDNYFRNVYEGY